MIDFSFFFLSISSISAVLLGICVTLRNNSFSGLLHPNIGEVKVENKDYEEVLKRSGKYSTLSGGFFVVSTVLGTSSFLLSHSYLSGANDSLWNLTLLTSGLFMLGVAFLGWALIFDYVRVEKPIKFEFQWPPISFTPPEQRSEKRPDTEPVDEEDEDTGGS